MIAALAPLGQKYRLQFIPEYGADGTVDVAVIFSRKDEKDALPKSVSFSGTIAEVEAALTDQLPKVVDKLVSHANVLDDLDKQLASEKATKEKDVADTKASKAARTSAKANKAARAKPDEKDEADEKSTPPASQEPPPAPAPATPTPPSLKPAWKAKAAAPAAQVTAPAPAAATNEEPEDLGALFPEETNASQG